MCSSRPQKLCRLCSDINLIDLFREDSPSIYTRASSLGPSIEHHADLFALSSAAQSGCQLCGLFYAGMLKSFEDFGPPEAEAFKRERLSRNISPKQLVVWAIKQPLHPQYAPFKIGYRALGYGRDYSRFRQTRDGPVACDATLDLLIESGDLPSMVARKINETPDFDLCFQWINECSRDHAACVTVKDRDLPTRLIDVGSTTSKAEPRLVNTKGKQGQYVALSHCWGDSKPPKTTTKTSSKHALAIPFVSLPRTFQDAVTVTRNLGFQYLWIDCFCILQDDESDWQRECASMHRTFANAAITIAGSSAGSADAGFLHKRLSTDADSCEIQIRDPGSRRAICSLRVTQSTRSHQSSAENKQLDSALATRGWIMQERLLSTRVLYFGAEQMYFECNSVDCHEDLRYPIYPEIAGTVGDDATVEKDIFLSDDPNLLTKAWYKVVVAYSSCKLTENKDKLPAFSGLASRYHEQTRDEYFAGLWRSSFEMGLTWFRDPDSTTPKSRFPAKLVPPSWSWASCDYKTMFAGFGGLRRKDMKSQITINSVSTNLIGLDPFGEVDGGSLSLTGTTKAAILQADTDTENDTQWLYPEWRDGDERVIARCHSDDAGPADPLEWRLEERPVTCLLIGIQPVTLEATASSFIALILEPVQGQKRNTFRRVGLVHTFLGYQEERDIMKEADSLRWIQSGTRKTVHIV